MYGQIELDTILKDPSITSLLTDPSYIWNDTVAPDMGVQTKQINYYRIGPVGPLDFVDVPYSVNCRAETQLEAETIARAVRVAANRQSSGSVFFVVSVLPVIRPRDETDNYNAPLEIQVKGRDV